MNVDASAPTSATAPAELATIVETNDFKSWLSERCADDDVLFVTSKGFSQRGVTDAVCSALTKGKTQVYDEVSPNPRVQSLAAMVHRFRNKPVSMIVALGGGSVIDTAKICSIWLTNPHVSFSALISNQSHSSERLPVVAIPTTAGTGAEVTPFATAWDIEEQKKYSVTGISPKWALLDPSLTLSLSLENTLYPAMDALSHGLESLWNVNANDQSRQYAQLAVEGVCEALPVVLDKPGDLDARQQLMKSASYAGLAISHTKTAIAHALSYPLTLKYDVPHGVACSVTLQAIIDRYDNDKLNLSDSLADKVMRLLEKVQITRHLEKFVSWHEVLENFDTKLDPSRAGNFSAVLNEQAIIDILQRSERFAKGELS